MQGRYVIAGCLLYAIGMGCGKNNMPMGMEDMAGSSSHNDGMMMAMPDLLNAPMAVTGLPNCTPQAVTADMLYTDVVAPRCTMGSGCHGTDQSMLFGMATADDMKHRWVNNTSVQAAPMVRIKPNNIDHSYVMYKIMGEQLVAGGGGVRMPNGRIPLPSNEVCEFMNWVQNGAM